MTTSRQIVAVELLGRLLSALDEFGADFDTEGDAICARITAPSGDVYRIRVEWDSEASP